MKSREPLLQDIARLQLPWRWTTEALKNSVSPGTIAVFQLNEWYPMHEAYVEAIAEAMREHETIVTWPLLRSIAPIWRWVATAVARMWTTRNSWRLAELHVDALNHALANIPADRVRFHVCWGNYEGPHTHDLLLTQILPVALKAKLMGMLPESANPRTSTEWEV